MNIVSRMSGKKETETRMVLQFKEWSNTVCALYLVNKFVFGLPKFNKENRTLTLRQDKGLMYPLVLSVEKGSEISLDIVGPYLIYKYFDGFQGFTAPQNPLEEQDF